MGVQERVFRTRVRQVGALRPRQNVAAAFTQGLRGALERLLRDQQDEIEDRDRVFFTIGSNRLVKSNNGWGLTAREWRRDSLREDSMLRHPAKMLNSNEQFEMNDSFQLMFVHVCGTPHRGGTKRQRKPVTGRRRCCAS